MKWTEGLALLILALILISFIRHVVVPNLRGK